MKLKAIFFSFYPRVEEYIKSGHDRNIVDPDPNKIYTKRKEHNAAASKDVGASVSGESQPAQPKYPSDGWSTDLTKMPFFTRAEMNEHVSKSGKNIDSSTSTHSVPTSVRKATTFLKDEYLKEILAASVESNFYFKSHCHHSFRKNDPPHNLKMALCIVSGKVKHAYCTCVAGAVGFCNHVLALMMKVCLFTVYQCKSVSDLDNQDDMQPKQACTSMLQQWHRKGRGDTIAPQPAMEVVVNKTHQDLHRSSSREPGVRCLLYEARTQQSIKSQSADEQKLVERLKAANPKMALAQIMEPSSERSKLFETKFGKSPQGSYASYQLSTTEDNFKVHCNISSVPRVDPGHTNTVPINAYPRFPLDRAREQFVVPEELAAVEKALLEKLCVDEEKINDIETKTREQSNCEEWKQERRLRFTASNFGLISARKRHHENFVNSLLHPKPFTSRYTNHGIKYEPVALEQYQKYMHSIRRPVKVLKSGLVVSLDAPYLGASPDGKVIDNGCSIAFGLSEVKCPETKFLVTPLDACSDSNFFLENVNGEPKLKRGHNYYTQVQGLMGVTGAQWCDFMVYTSKGMSIERIPFDREYWNNLKRTLKSYYFTHFLPKAAREP